jgi:hypothetical protein
MSSSDQSAKALVWTWPPSQVVCRATSIAPKLLTAADWDAAAAVAAGAAGAEASGVCAHAALVQASAVASASVRSCMRVFCIVAIVMAVIAEPRRGRA